MVHLATGLLFSWSLVLITSHWIRTKQDLNLLCDQVVKYVRALGRTVLHSNTSSTKRVDEAMDRIREENYVLTCRLLQHAALSGLITIPVTYGDDLVTCFGMMLFAIFSYTVHTSIANGSLRVSAKGLRYLFGAYYIMFIAFLCASPETDIFTFAANQKALLAAQFAAVVCFVDSRVHIPGQLAIVLAETIRYLASHSWGFAALEFVGVQFAFAMIVIAASIVHEHTLRERLSAQFRHVDAESLISSFRTLLRGVCDAEMLLDGQLRIQDAGAGLNRILSASGNLQGQDFEKFLVHSGDEKDRFRNFISTQRESRMETPPCLRVSLLQNAGGRLGADLFHVVVPHLNGCEGVYHLLAMKLDPESYAVPEAEEPPLTPPLPPIASPQYGSPQLNLLNLRRPASRASGRSERSEGSLLRSSPHLKEIMLLVDLKDQQEVLQVHLSYQDRKRKRGRRDSPSSSQGSMPVLRDFVRPTDWGTLRGKLERYGARGDSVSEESLGRMWIRMLDRPSSYMLARQARLKPFAASSEGSSQLWLHLKDFRPGPSAHEQRAPSELEDIGEAGVDSEPESG